MSVLYALVVGIDTYRAVSPLSGCRNDAAEVMAYLRGRTSGSDTLSYVELLDDRATRVAVIDGFRTHLRRAGPDDTALFFFAGHGSEAPVPPGFWNVEPLGRMQTLVCADSRHDGVPDLYDKELSLLLDEVAAGGAHVAVVLDSCHSGGATRDAAAHRGRRTRGVLPAAELPDTGTLLRDGRPGSVGATGPASIGYVALSACREFELAEEAQFGGTTRGLFSWALLRGLRQLGPSATYRELLTAARCAVEDHAAHQVPRLLPVDGHAADQPFLGGRVTPPRAGMVLRHVRGGWEIDAGSCHGLSSSLDEPLRVGVPGDEPREARVTAVLTERSVVQPDGWTPDQGRQYPVVLSSIPLPATTVAIGAPDEQDAVATALATAGPTGGPSPYLRRVDGVAGLPADLEVRFPRPGRIRIVDSEGRPLTADIVATDPAEAGRRAVTAMEHIARWRTVKELRNPYSSIAGGVVVEVVEPLPGERVAPRDRSPVAPDPDGLVRLRYLRSTGGWTTPSVFIRLRNRSGRPLYCVLLDLTDRYRIHTGLFPGAFVGAGHVGAALDGQPVEFSLPPGAMVRPGARTRDWLTLLVAEEEFSALPFELPRLGAPPMPRGSRGLGGVLEKLGRAAVHRDAGPGAVGRTYDWCTATVPVLTEVAGDSRRPSR